MSRRLLPTILLATLAGGCAFAPGTGFATLQAAPLTVSFTPGDGRRDAEGRFKTDLGYRLSLTSLSLTVDTVAFQATSGRTGPAAGASATFDPAKPPAGYTLCHGGHCHRQDGALVDYADIQAELAGGGVPTLQDVLTLPVNRPLNLLTLQPSDLPMLCQNGCQLDQGSWSRGEIRFGKLEASGTVSDGTPDQRLGPNASRAWRLSWTPPALGQRLNLTISRKTPATLKPTIQFQLSDQLFDRIDWATLPSSIATPVVLDSLPDVTRQLAENVAQSTFTLRLDPQ